MATPAGATRAGGGPPGGGGGVTSFNGRTGAVVPTAGDYTAADVGALALAGGTMSGDIDMGANAVTNATTVNGVALTTAGPGTSYLADDGSYKNTPDAAWIELQYSDVGNRAPGAALRSGGDLFGNLTPGSGTGQPTRGGTIREVAWRRTTTPAGSIRVAVIDAAGNERTFVLVAVGAGVANGNTPGLNVAVNAGEQVAVLWDASSTGTTRDLAVTVFLETGP